MIIKYLAHYLLSIWDIFDFGQSIGRDFRWIWRFFDHSIWRVLACICNFACWWGGWVLLDWNFGLAGRNPLTRQNQNSVKLTNNPSTNISWFLAEKYPTIHTSVRKVQAFFATTLCLCSCLELLLAWNEHVQGAILSTNLKFRFDERVLLAVKSRRSVKLAFTCLNQRFCLWRNSIPFYFSCGPGASHFLASWTHSRV